MNLNRPVLVKWQTDSKMARFIRRHRWFFENDMVVGSYFMIVSLFCVGVCTLVLGRVLQGNQILALSFAVIFLGSILALFILAHIALEINNPLATQLRNVRTKKQ